MAWGALAAFFTLAVAATRSSSWCCSSRRCIIPAVAILGQVESQHADHVYVDCFALRDVYDYQVPPDTTDYHFSLPDWRPNSPPEVFPPNSLLVRLDRNGELHGEMPAGGHDPARALCLAAPALHLDGGQSVQAGAGEDRAAGHPAPDDPGGDEIGGKAPKRAEIGRRRTECDDYRTTVMDRRYSRIPLRRQ
ncbi:MAG: hypothetical protein WDO13_05040 [Verrucomicrobiota bacterium]